MVLTNGQILSIAMSVAVIMLLMALRIYARMTCGMCESSAKMTGQTVIITGATSGIGKETARDIARRGARLILACRNIEAANQVKDELVKETGNEDIVVKKLDISSMKSVRQFAADINMNERRLHVLIHNAGVVYLNICRLFSIDGLDLTMATNYFGPFLLTHLLIDLLKRSAPARIVMVSSEFHKIGTWEISEKQLNPPGFKYPFLLYCYSKYVEIIFTLELARRLKGTGVTANCLHPGMIDSSILRYAWFPLNVVLYLISKIYFKSVEEGAQTTIHCAVCDKTANKSGHYFKDCKVAELSPRLRSLGSAKELWKISEQLTLGPKDPKIALPQEIDKLWISVS